MELLNQILVKMVQARQHMVQVRLGNKVQVGAGDGERTRYKRRENINNFIKKTVVPYPRLG